MLKRSILLVVTLVALVLAVAYFSLGRGRVPSDESLPNTTSTSAIESDFDAEEIEHLESSPVKSEGEIADSEENVGARSSGREVASKKVLQLIGTEQNPGLATYAETVDGLDVTSVPLLREMLMDPTFKNRWRGISCMVAWLSDKSDKKSLDAILEYVRRPDIWSDIGTQDGYGYGHIYGKTVALSYLGLFELTLATDTLRAAFTQEGAEELVGAWIHLPHEVEGYTRQEVISDVRGGAAAGLALSQDSENIELLKLPFEAFIHESLSRGDSDFDIAEAELDGGFALHYVIDAMAKFDVIKDVGMEVFLRTGNLGERLSLSEPYIMKYKGRRLPDRRRVWESCPFCGKTEH